MYDYGYEDGKLVFERVGGQYEINYRYDENGNLFTFTRTDYEDGSRVLLYAVNNTRGDLIELRTGSGVIYAKYTYDSWGNLISVTDANGNALPSNHAAHYNSIRYRGYVYDRETGLYYLQSRYYDAEVGRFLNADSVDYIGYSGEDISYNAFAYCENNAVNYSDPIGTIKIYIGWLWCALDLLIIIIPMVGKINAVLAKAGKAHSSVIKSVSTFLSKYYSRFSSALKKAAGRFVNKSLSTQIASIVANGIFKTLAMLTIFSSIGNFVQYVVDCLDGKWDNYLDTSKKLRIQLIWRRT